MNLLATLALVLGLTTYGETVTAPTSNAKPISHETWNSLLKKYVDNTGMVDYRSLKEKDAKTLDKYLELVSSNAPGNDWSKDEKLAYWLNAYNAFTIKQILDMYPTNSIIRNQLQLVSGSGPFNKKYFKIGGKDMSLNNIEQDIVRKEFNEPRIHFALVCAAISCPKLRNEAYVPAKLDAQLADQAKDFLNNPKKNAISKEKVSVSKIFDWYKDDFGKSDENVVKFINKYSSAKANGDANVSYMKYDWNLNDQKNSQ
ncbi:MAG: DUF547 domain-containing protein [Cytophagaceae bacterium]|nr:DUF547 domain-containing protein [Cytophagaceae bacterium]